MPNLILAGLIGDAEDINQAPTTYVPTLTAFTTDPTLGSGATQTGWFYRIGLLVVGEAHIRFGTSAAAGDGPYEISLPVAADTAIHNAGGGTGIASTLGSGALRDNSGIAASRPCTPYLQTATTVRMLTSNGNVDDANPWIWADGDAMRVFFAYLIPES